MAISPSDRFAINDLISLHGHLMDSGELDRLDELFIPDVVYDVSDLGYDPLVGFLRSAMRLSPWATTTRSATT